MEKDHLARCGLRLRTTGLLGVGFFTLCLKRHNTDLHGLLFQRSKLSPGHGLDPKLVSAILLPNGPCLGISWRLVQDLA